jgi:hypothetical protein
MRAKRQNHKHPGIENPRNENNQSKTAHRDHWLTNATRLIIQIRTYHPRCNDSSETQHLAGTRD